MVAALSASIQEVSTSKITTPSTSFVLLPPAPTHNAPPLPPIITTNAQSAGLTFGRQGTRVRPSDTSTTASVTINGRRHEGPVFDINGNPIVCLLSQILKVFTHLVGWPTFYSFTTPTFRYCGQSYILHQQEEVQTLLIHR